MEYDVLKELDFNNINELKNLKSNEAVYIVNLERKILYWSDKAYELTGYSKEEMEGKHCFETKIKHQDFNGTNLCTSFCPLVATMYDLCARHKDVTFMHKNGVRKKVRVSTYPLFYESDCVGAIEIFYLI